MLHPQVEALLCRTRESDAPPLQELPPELLRDAQRKGRPLLQPDAPEVGSVRDLHAPGPRGPIPLRSYRPAGSSADDPLPVLVYFHGGGFVFGDLDSHDVLCRQLTNDSGCAVISVDYRLAPEHRFPAAPEDAIAAARWVYGNAAALKIDPHRMAVGGDSAGGNLATVTALWARDTGDMPIAFQLLIYPSTDQREHWPSRVSNAHGYLLTKELIDYCHDLYITDPAQDLDWRASPLLHSSHAGLPPAFIITAGYDPLRDEGMQYAQAMTKAGSQATLVNFERQIHAFIVMGRVIDEANVAVQMCAFQLKRALMTG